MQGRTLFINTTTAESSTSNSFVCKVGPQPANGVKVTRITIPHSYTNVNENNNNFSLTRDGVTYNLTLPIMQYSIPELAGAISTLASNVEVGGPMVAVAPDSDGFVLIRGLEDHTFTFTFSPNVATMLGLPTTVSSPYTSTVPSTPNWQNEILVTIIGSASIRPASSTNFKITTSIPVDGYYGDINSYTDPAGNVSTGGMGFDTITITLEDDEKRPLNMNDKNVTVTLMVF